MGLKMNEKRCGFTLTELMVTVAMVVIVIVGMGVVLVDSHRGWNRMYGRVYGDVATDGYVTKKAFDTVVRKSSQKRYVLGTGNVTVFYYKDLSSTKLDRYANFRAQGGKLFVDYGELDGAGALLGPYSSVMLARNLEAVNFAVDGACVRILARLNDGDQTTVVTCSAIRHNE